MLPLGVRPNQSGQGNAAGHRRFEAGGCAECMALVAVLLRASETETIGMAPARKRRSNSGSSSNRYAECPLLGVKRTCLRPRPVGLLMPVYNPALGKIIRR